MAREQPPGKSDSIGNKVSVSIDRRKKTVRMVARFGTPFGIALVLLLLAVIAVLYERREGERSSPPTASARPS
jgi:hypothetical protein